MDFNLFLKAFLLIDMLPMRCFHTLKNIKKSTEAVTFTTQSSWFSKVRRGSLVQTTNRRRGEPEQQTSDEQDPNHSLEGSTYKSFPPNNQKSNVRMNQESLRKQYGSQSFGLPLQDADSDDMPLPEKGPSRNKFYDPHRGYEMYWENGHWVFNTPTPNYPANTCGHECLPMFKAYGQVCARNRYFVYATFDDYCEMKDDDCLGSKDWTVVHTGECNPYWQTKNWARFMSKPPLGEWAVKNFTGHYELEYSGEKFFYIDG